MHRGEVLGAFGFRGLGALGSLFSFRDILESAHPPKNIHLIIMYFATKNVIYMTTATVTTGVRADEGRKNTGEMYEYTYCTTYIRYEYNDYSILV